MSSSWLSIAPDSDFSIHNLPFGVFSSVKNEKSKRCATILGDTVIDLSVLEEAGLFADIVNLNANVFCQETLNAFIEHPKPVWLAVRQRLLDLFSSSADPTVCNNENLKQAAFHKVSTVQLHLPITVGDYTDFYSSREHATNVGTMFRGKDNALQPNWLHLPVGYHGRSSTVFVTGQPIRRPCGQLQKDANDPKQGSIYGPCKLLDFELEMAAVVGGPPNPAGTALTVESAKDRIFGLMLMNDWSARDIQKWEYVPLGPFTSKNFGTTVSPWIVMTAALEAAPTSAIQQTDPVPLPYLQDPDYSSYNVALTVAIQGQDQSAPTTVCESNFKNLYWNAAQQLVHHSVTGCVMRAGDLLGSGTISGSSPTAFGSMLELSWKGSKTVKVGDQERKFLKDGDTVFMTGVCEKPGAGSRVGFGDCTGTILPALTGDDGKAEESKTVQGAEERYKDFKLYGYWRSSSTWRVRVALAAKSIAYETVPVNLLKNEHKTEDYQVKNPLGQVPLLEFTDSSTGKTIWLAQSLAIIKFLEQVFPKRKSLIPQDFLDEAVAFEIVELINAGIQPLQNVFFLGGLEKQSEGKIQAKEVAKSVNEKGLIAVEELVKRRRATHSGPYCLGSFSPTIADACVVPQLYNARRFGVNVDSVCPTLVEIDEMCASHAWFQASHPKVQPDAAEQ